MMREHLNLFELVLHWLLLGVKNGHSKDVSHEMKLIQPLQQHSCLIAYNIFVVIHAKSQPVQGDAD